MTVLKKVPSAPEMRQRSRWFLTTLWVSLSTFSLLAIFAHQYPYFGFDLFITRQIQLINFTGFNYLMLMVTNIGYIIPGTFLLITSCMALIFLKKVADAGILALSTIGAVLISLLFKAIVSRPRPDPDLIQQSTQYQIRDSFPSGHVLFFMGLVGFLLYLSWIYLPKSYLRVIVIAIWVVLLILMGMSRIYLGAHWFSDTLGAYLIGGFWLLCVITLHRHFGNLPQK